jgi:heptosyltransferase-1
LLCENECLQTQSKYRLLVVRLGAMGDILHALPAVTALRLQHPGWVIDWVVEPRWRALLAAPDSTERGSDRPVPGRPVPSRPLVDQLHFAPARDWSRSPLRISTLRQVTALRRVLRSPGYNTAIDFQGAIRSAVIARMAAAPRLIGEAVPREPAARWLFTERVVTHGEHVIEQDMELARQIAGDELVPTPPLLPIDPASEAWCDQLLGSSSELLALLNPGAGWGAKRWPIERYATVARGLIARGFRVMVNAGPGEVPLAEAVVEGTTGQGTSGAATALAMSLDQLIALTRRVSICIAGDTGPLHLACALGRPVVGIYGPTDPSRNGPYGTRFRVLRSPASRRDHSRRAEPEAGLLTITPEAVLEAADDLMSTEAASDAEKPQ